MSAKNLIIYKTGIKAFQIGDRFIISTGGNLEYSCPCCLYHQGGIYKFFPNAEQASAIFVATNSYKFKDEKLNDSLLFMLMYANTKLS